MKPVINIVLIGNHAVFMEFVASSIGQGARFRILGVAHRAADLIDFANDNHIHLAVLDADAMGECCESLVEAMRAIQPHCCVLFLSARADDAAILSALEARANGLVLKDEVLQTILPAVQEVLDGGSWFPESVRSRLVIDSLGVRLTPRAADGAGDAPEAWGDPGALLSPPRWT
ncbi:MAG TPA: hypothetical protein VMV94_15535 [Phycisphaerae bacterium]|nr:hypothetical protein [Phycisphaerae bacterium]